MLLLLLFLQPVETTASGLLSRDESSVGSADRELVFSQGEYSLRCGNGYQTRNVRCRKRDSGVVRNKVRLVGRQTEVLFCCVSYCFGSCSLCAMGVGRIFSRGVLQNFSRGGQKW